LVRDKAGGRHHDGRVMRLLPTAGALGMALALFAIVLPGAALAEEEPRTAVEIPFTRYQLDNGLTVILHEDRTQPLVVVNVDVDVGSRDEPPRRTGFAHLFEHLMFMGTERVPEKMFDEWMERQGGWNNAWTSTDRTNYFDVGPTHILPLLLWMEADRLSALGEQITDAKLETQRQVVRNERRQQTEAQPYGIAELRQPELLFPAGHPYHHPIIGSHEDLEAASVADVKAFFGEWYVPENMSLVIAGDFDPKTTKPLIERYFGALKKGKKKPAHRVPSEPAKLTREVRETLEDKVTFPKIIISFLSPALFRPGDAELDIISDVLTSGKASRLYKKLVYDAQVAQEVSCYQASRKLRSHFDCEILVRPDADLAAVEKLVDEELERLKREPVTAEELARAKNQYEAGFVTRLQSLQTRASLLQTYLSATGDPGYAAKDLQRYLDVTAADVTKTAKDVFRLDQRVVMTVLPKATEATPEAAE
jgi:zinc protease